MGVHVRVKRGKLYLDVYTGGRRTWEALHMTLSGDKQTDKEMMRTAAIVKGRRELALASGEQGIIDPAAGRKSLAAYAKELGERARYQSFKTCVPHIVEFAGSLTLGAVTERTVEAFQDFLRSQKLSLSTCARFDAFFRQVLKTAVRDRLIPRSPAGGVKTIKAPDAERTILTQAEFAALVRTPVGGTLGADVKRAFLFGCMTGLRVSDLKRATWGNIVREPVLSINMTMQKTGKTILVPLNPGAWGLIKDSQTLDRAEPLFPVVAGTKTNPTKYLKAWAAAAGLTRPLGFHDARRAFASWTLAAGADATTVQRLLGHSKISMTALYAKTGAAAFRAAVDSLPALDMTERQAGA